MSANGDHQYLDGGNQAQASGTSSTHCPRAIKNGNERYSHDYNNAEAQYDEDQVNVHEVSIENRTKTPLPAVTRLDINDSRRKHFFSTDANEEGELCVSPVEEKRPEQRSSINAANLHEDPWNGKTNVVTTLPSRRNRYDKSIIIELKYHDNVIFGPLTSKRVYEKEDSGSWRSYTHPEGLRYFYWAKGDCNSHHFSYLTDDNICDPTVRKEIEDFISSLERTADQYQDELPENAEAVLQIEETADVRWQYYIADLDEKKMIWMHDFNASWIATLLGGIGHLQQLKNYFDYEFWSHVENFPCHRQVYQGLLEELLGYTMHGWIDMMTSLDSIIPYTESRMRDSTDLVEKLIALHRDDKANASEYVVSASARLMSVIAFERFVNLYGSHGAHISRGQRDYGLKDKKSWLIKIFSPLLFFAPEIHLHEIHSIWIDGVITQRDWDHFFKEFKSGREQFILYATVILTANVSFQAIPTVISSQGPPIWVSPAQVFSQISIITSIGSIIMGLLMPRQAANRQTAEGSAQFLHRYSRGQRGLETLAIIYSLPYALLMWSMVTFIPAIGITCFLSIDGKPIGVVPCVVYSFAWLSVLSFSSWTILTGWEIATKGSWMDIIPLWGFWRRWKREEIKEETEEDLLPDSGSIPTSKLSKRFWKRRIRLMKRMRRSKLGEKH